MNVELILFWAFAALTLLSAGLVVWSKNPMNAAMSLVATFFFLAGIYVLLWAHTIAVFQVIVYAGAIMVLFLFVIMLLSLTETGLRREAVTPARVIGAVAALGLFGALVYTIASAELPARTLSASAQSRFGTIERMGDILFTTYLLPFQAVGLLLLVAIVGAVVVAKPRI